MHTLIYPHTYPHIPSYIPSYTLMHTLTYPHVPSYIPSYTLIHTLIYPHTYPHIPSFEIMFAYLYLCLGQIFSDRLQIFGAYTASHEGLEFTDAKFEEVGLTQGDGKARIRALPFTAYKKVQTTQ